MSSSETIVAPNATIHLSYDVPPSHPGPQWTRFVCVSDTHSECFSVPLGDVLLHSGDLSSFGKAQQLKVTMDWINSLPHPTKIVIAGNHDLSLDANWYENEWPRFHKMKENTGVVKSLMIGDEARYSHVIYLQSSSVEIQVKRGGRRWKIYGYPGSPWFGGWAFNYERGKDAQEIHQSIPVDTDILLTHGPPENILDMVHDGTHVGCRALLKRLEEVRPVLHAFGHIHEDRGIKIHQWPPSVSDLGGQATIFVNAANTPSGQKAANLRNQGITPMVGGPGFQPIIVDLFDPVNSMDTRISA